MSQDWLWGCNVQALHAVWHIYYLRSTDYVVGKSSWSSQPFASHQTGGFRCVLDGGDLGNILLPKRYVPADINYGDELDVFIYRDSEDELSPPLKSPRSVLVSMFSEGEEVNNVGAFLDWGLPKDLLVPFREQNMRRKIILCGACLSR